ncbi:MAG: tRNA (adenosine(37)-N6)-threonylcarbamoyltransferase complex dimerization subunit type 1 TsaB [candidate division WOR-3 bacterium]|nr:tRNA (adenosine(37)-N6)-threonylcarbamoyltransferase complex dimerization subunit type 1 TsaB [candidate division WOR-3 bacterium]
MKILGIDTSTTVFSVCLSEDNKILYEVVRERTYWYNQSDGNLFNLIKNLMNTSEKIDAIALTIGPGMFTSLRVGLAIAKGLYLSRNIPICGVNTLEVIANSLQIPDFIKDEYIISPVMEAFQKEIFTAFFTRRERVSKDLIFTPEEFFKFIRHKFNRKKIIAIGPGVKLIKNQLSGGSGQKIFFNDSPLFYPSSAKVVFSALPKIKNGIFDNPELLEPHYIKRTSAESKCEK